MRLRHCRSPCICDCEKDAAIRRAAWRFITFATQPAQPAEVAGLTDYFPPNDRAVGLLQDFYRADPNFAVAVSERRYASGWYAFPEPNGLKVIDVIKDKLESARLALDRCRAGQN
jgi:multiple sugar transport system substrate-binding protein